MLKGEEELNTNGQEESSYESDSIESDMDINQLLVLQYINSSVDKIESGDYQSAIDTITNAIAIDPNQNLYKCFNTRGAAKAHLGDYSGALTDYNKAIEINSSYVDAYYNRGVLRENIKDYSGALADYTKAIEINPSYADAYYSRGLVKANSKEHGDLKDACEDWKKAAELGDEGAAELLKKHCEQ